MRRTISIFPLVIGLLLSACFEEPKLQADTEANFNTSFAVLTKDLSSADTAKLDAALKDIALVEAGIYGPMLAAKNYQLPSSQPGAATFASVMTTAIEQGVAASWDANRAKVVVQNARALVDGHTAKEILVIADSERKKGIEAALAIYRDQLAKANSALDDARAEIEAAQRKRAEQQIILQHVEITATHFYYEKSRFSDQPSISFTIANRGVIPIKRIFVHGKVQTPGRAIPWVEDDFNYAFPGGLEPKEVKGLNLAPNMFSGWGHVPKEAVNGSILDLTLTAFEDAAGNRYGDDPADHGQVELRKKALEDGIQMLKDKINELEAKLRQGG